MIVVGKAGLSLYDVLWVFLSRTPLAAPGLVNNFPKASKTVKEKSFQTLI